MIHYPEHIINSNSNSNISTGIISIEKGYASGMVNNILIPNQLSLNRALNGDLVYYDNNNNTITNIDRCKHTIIGILKIMSNITYGLNSSGIPYYRFVPNDSIYPEFNVAFNVRNKGNKEYKAQGKNIYCIIEFGKWPNTSIIPYGNLKQIIGSVGILENEYNFILHKHNLFNKPCKYKLDELVIDDNINDENLNIITIDPKGCLDVDDAIHYKDIAITNLYEIGIHIADVSRYVQPNSDIDNYARTVLSTIYMPNSRQDMLPTILSTENCSLKQGCPRYSASLILEINSDGEIVNYKFEKRCIKVKKAYTYEEVDKILVKKKRVHNIINLMDVAGKLEKRYNLNVQSELSHKLVEIYMVIANMLACKYIIERQIKFPLIRTHKSKPIVECKDNEILEQIYKESAKYEIYNYDNSMDIKHSGLGLEYYTHMTSPIRRYADIIVHRMIYDNYSINETDLCMKLNEMNGRLKKYYRDIEYIQLVQQLDKNDIELVGYIIELYDKMITVYIKEYKLSVTFRLFNKKLDNLINYIYENENDLILENNIDQNKRIKLSVGQAVNIRLVGYIMEEKFKDKLKIRMIRPNINELI
jgi:exoribonuclease R